MPPALIVGITGIDGRAGAVALGVEGIDASSLAPARPGSRPTDSDCGVGTVALPLTLRDDSAGIDDGGGDEAARAAHPATESRARNHTQREIIDVLPR